jgi:hypothetical protein
MALLFPIGALRHVVVAPSCCFPSAANDARLGGEPEHALPI